MRAWIGPAGAKTDFITPRSLSENGSCEGFYARLREELLKAEVFYSLHEAQSLIER